MMSVLYSNRSAVMNMKKITTILLLLIHAMSVSSQALPDKILVVRKVYGMPNLIGEEDIVESDTIVLTNRRKVLALYEELVKFDEEGQLLSKFGIDTAFVLNNPDAVLKLYEGEGEIDWNEKQREFIFSKITDVHVLREGLDHYLSEHTPHRRPFCRFLRSLKFRRVAVCGLGIPRYYYEYVILLYNENEVTNVFASRKSYSDYSIPYRDQSNRVIYNYKIDQRLNRLFKQKIKIDEPLKGDALLKYIVNRVVANNKKELYRLSAYSYEKEISELSSDFEIISSEEVYGRGRYLGDEPKTMRITLKNEYMLPNVYLQFLDSKYGETLYPRDSIFYSHILACDLMSMAICLEGDN